jgi:GT2 family glycosyltransferase
MKLSVVIVNYNVRFFLEQTLLSAKKAAEKVETEIFVVDNNSVDDSVQMVKERFPDVMLIANKDNPGFSKANNQAIRQSKGEYVLLLNPDTVVNEDTFEKCVNFMDQHPDCGGLGIKMIDGSGKFLPESKRGFPSPAVAFYKTFGLSSIFPKSPIFNQYHLGYLDKDKTHKIDVLSGAFMMLRKSVLDEVGLLDEAFFMYGEDIDLSYRIKKAGYENYYYADSTIIHYKGESTKKGSLNYVKVFYNAMIIFAKKHFTGTKGSLFILMLQAAIYLRAAMTLASNFTRKAFLPFLDITSIGIGLFFLKDFWANYYYKSPDYYDDSFIWFNIPLYTSIWVLSIFFSGGYDEKDSLRRPIRGLFIGTILLAAIYGFLDLEFRSSRMLIVLGAVWAAFSVMGIRLFLHFIQYKNFNIGVPRPSNLVIVGSQNEVDRTLKLLQESQVNKNIIGSISPDGNDNNHSFNLGRYSQLDEIIRIYKVNEIIFCSKDIESHKIMDSMSSLGSAIQYKILPEKSISIIGSHSKNHSGELYTIDVAYNISSPINKRNKRFMDIGLSFLFILFLPIIILFIKNKSNFIKNIFNVLFSKKTWVGYSQPQQESWSLPSLKPSILHPIDAFSINNQDVSTLQKLDFFYAKDYTSQEDLFIIWKGFRGIGN